MKWTSQPEKTILIWNLLYKIYLREFYDILKLYIYIIDYLFKNLLILKRFLTHNQSQLCIIPVVTS